MSQWCSDFAIELYLSLSLALCFSDGYVGSFVECFAIQSQWDNHYNLDYILYFTVFPMPFCMLDMHQRQIDYTNVRRTKRRLLFQPRTPISYSSTFVCLPQFLLFNHMRFHLIYCDRYPAAYVRMQCATCLCAVDCATVSCGAVIQQPWQQQTNSHVQVVENQARGLITPMHMNMCVCVCVSCGRVMAPCNLFSQPSRNCA